MHCQKCGEKLGEDMKFCAKCGHEVGAPVLPVYDAVSMGTRLLNFIIDGFGASIFGIIIGLLVGFLNVKAVPFVGILYVAMYYILFESLWQRTPAKWITGTKVVTFEGTKPRFLRIVGRTLCRYIPFDALTYFFDSNPVGWHDRFSKTLVVPKTYTAEQVRKIDLSKRRGGSKVLIVLAVMFGLFIVLGILGTIILASLGAAREKANQEKLQTTDTSLTE